MSSVLKSKRGETKFDLIIKARELCVYTLRITDNKNVFPIGCQEDLISQIRNLSIDIFKSLYDANNIDIRKTNKNLKEDFKTRRRYISKAIRECYDLLALIQIAKPIFHLSSKRIKYWAYLTINVREGARGLKESDRDRLTANKL